MNKVRGISRRPMKIKLKLQFIFYDHISLILSVINVFMSHTTMCERLDGARSLSSAHTWPHLWIFTQDFMLTIGFSFILFRLLFERFCASRESGNFERVPFAKRTNFLTIFFISCEVLREETGYGWEMVRWKTINTHKDRYILWT